jgi:hypothetical protein
MLQSLRHVEKHPIPRLHNSSKIFRERKYNIIATTIVSWKGSNKCDKEKTDRQKRMFRLVAGVCQGIGSLMNTQLLYFHL